MKKETFFLTFVVAGMLTYLQACKGSSTPTEEELPDEISYNFDIRPILSDKCLTCHGPDANKRQAGLRLDDPVSAFAALKENPSAHALVAGKPNKSEVFLRITTKDTAKMMPPKESNLTLSPPQVSLIEPWIKQGAK